MSFKKNMGTADRFIRLALAVVFVALILTNTVSGILAIVLGIFAAVFVVTSTVSFCPAYFPFSFSTRGKE